MPPTDHSWLHRPFIYAALAATDDLAEAARLLALRGMNYTEKQLDAYRKNGAHCLQQAREHGLHKLMLNQVCAGESGSGDCPAYAEPSTNPSTAVSTAPSAGNSRSADASTDDLYARLDDMARRIERRLAAGDWQEKNEVDLVDRYLKLMQQMADMRERRQSQTAQDQANPDMEEVLRRLEQAGDTGQIHDAMRRAAAATGTLFDAPAPQRPDMG